MKIEEICDQYLLEEPDAALAHQIRELLQARCIGDRQQLMDRMQSIQFGTAGLRGKMEAGYNRMNMVSVYRFSYALAQELLATIEKKISVVIGFDGRHHSKDFASEIAANLNRFDIAVFMFDECVPTPLCAYAAKKLNANAGVMVTASHNPHYDNGIKLYQGSSAQAHGNALKRLENAMKLAPLRNEFIKKFGDPLSIGIVPTQISLDYLAEIKQTKFFKHEELNHDLSIVYTPLHGVGKRFFLAALRQEGFNTIDVVYEQAEPDSDFSTVLFPNPEEENTLDLAHKLAIKKKHQWVFANDPDADRLQVSCDDSGIFRKLTGNEMGVVLGYFSIITAQRLGIKPLLASSIVSSRMLSRMCQSMGARYVESLTGFSNIVDAAMKQQSISGDSLVFAYEEAIGFLVGQTVLDKDGISAGVRFMEIASHLQKIKKSIWQFLDDLYLQFGLFESIQWSLRFEGASQQGNLARAMAKLRSYPVERVANCLAESECKKYDLTEEQKFNSYENLRADVVIYEINPRMRLIIRPSGTEPKIKIYLELYEKISDMKELLEKKLQLKKKLLILKNQIDGLFFD